MELDIYILMELMAVSTGIFLGIHYLTLNLKSKSNHFLALFMLISFLPDLLPRIIDVQSGHWFIPIWISSSFLYIPFLYFYALSISGSFKNRYYFLLSPAVIMYVLLIVSRRFNWEYSIEIDLFIINIFNLFVLTLLLRTLHSHQKNIFSYFSSIEEKSLNWLRILALVMLIFNALGLLESFISFFSPVELLPEEFFLFATFITVYWVAFKSLRQPEIFTYEYEPIEDNNTEKETPSLNSSEKELFSNLQTLMLKEQLYKNPELSLRSLALELETNEKVLSRVINIEAEQNFYNFINTYRLDAFKKSLQDNPETNLTLFGLAQEFGFKSKSTFYAVFKKLEGCTPSNYIQESRKL